MASGQFRKIQNQFPSIDPQAEAREQAALNVQMQGAMAGSLAQPGGNIRQKAAQVGAAGTQAQTQLGAQQAQTRMQNQAAGAELGMAAQRQQAQATLQSAAMAQEEGLAGRGAGMALSQQKADLAARKTITQAQIDQAQRLNQLGLEQDNRLNFLTIKQREQVAALSQDVSNQLFDSNMRFERDEMGRKFSNERQLQDYLILNAQNEQALMDKAQEMQQVVEREIYMLEHAQKVLMQALEQGFLSEKQKLDNASREKIARYIADMEKAIEDKKRKAAARGQMITGGVQLLGGVAMMAVGSTMTVASGGALTPVGASMVVGGAGMAAQGGATAGAGYSNR
jgi:hypothetical protein